MDQGPQQPAEQDLPLRQRARRWSWIIALALAGLLLYLALRGVDWTDFVATARQGNPGRLLLAGLLLSMSYVVRGLRWRLLLNHDRWIPPGTVFWAAMVGYLGNNLLPARAGELLRVVLISRKAQINSGFALATALTERLMDVVALVLISLLAALFLTDLPAWLQTSTQIMAGLGIIGVAGLLIVPKLESPLKQALARMSLPGPWHARLQNLVTQFLLGMRAFQRLRSALGFAGLTIVVWLLDGLVAIGVAGAFELALALPQALLLLAALGLASAAPSTPGYVGIFQFVAVTVLAPFGFLRSEALLFIIAFQLVNYSVVILWGVIGLWKLQALKVMDGLTFS